MTQDYQLETILAHAGINSDEATGALASPIHFSTTYQHPEFGQSTGFDYTRTKNPTRATVEKTLAAIEKADYAIATSSGMSAIVLAFEIFPVGSKVVAARDLYGGSFRWFNDKEKEGRFFFEYTNTEDEMIAAIAEDTDIVYIETPTNPLMIEFDIEKDKENGKKWSLSNNLNDIQTNSYITYGLGFVNFKNIYNGIYQELNIFVPKEDTVKINILNLKNLHAKKRKLKLLYYIKDVLGEDEIKTNGNIQLVKEANVIFANNLYKDSFKRCIPYITTSENIRSYTGDKKAFIGNQSIKNPIALDLVSLDNSSGLGQNSCIAIELEVELEGYESKEISIVFGEEESKLDAKNTAYKYSKITNCTQELNKEKAFWYELVSRVQVKTPIESINIMLNGWATYQTIVSRLWSRTGYQQSGGAIGFRDQLQDTIGLKYTDINFMKEQILIACRHQFIEGDVEHWWHDDINRGIRTRFSDDLLWLCYLVYEYINFTGDYTILEEEQPYVMGELLPDGVDERYDVYLESKQKENVYTHCIRAIDRSLNFGEHGLPKIGSGDWNDGLNTVGNKQKGESIWLGFFIYNILEKFIPICEKRGDISRVNEYKIKKENLKKALNTAGWDGRWFRRAYMDNRRTFAEA